MSILNCLFLHRFTKSVNIFIGNIQSSTQSLVEIAVAALKHQLFYHILIGEAGSSGDTDIYAALFTESLDIIRPLSSFRNLYDNDRFSVNRL